jgi:predicted permease
MLTFIGIALYLAIGYIFVCLADANEDGFWDQVKVILFWPILWITLIACCIVFTFIGIRNHIKKKK